jgi:hypothetical protein
MFFDYILRALSGDIEVEVSPDYFYFRRKGQEKKFRTISYLSAHGNPRFLWTGDDQIITEPNIRIDFFKRDESTIEAYEKGDCLVVFFKNCLLASYNRKSLVRPRIIFRHSTSLKDVLCGYQKYILEKVALSAGAYECIFQD